MIAQIIFSKNLHNKDFVSLSDVCIFTPGYTYSSNELTESNIGMVSIKSFDRTGGFKADTIKPLNPKKSISLKLCEIGDILVAQTDLTSNQEIIGSPIIINSMNGFNKLTFSMDLVKVESKNSSYSNALIYRILQAKHFKNHALSYCNGSTVVHMNKKALEEYKFPEIDKSVLIRLNHIFNQLQNLEIKYIKKLETMKKIKSALLHKYF